MHITGMLLPKDSAPILLGTTYSRFFPRNYKQTAPRVISGILSFAVTEIGEVL